MEVSPLKPAVQTYKNDRMSSKSEKTQEDVQNSVEAQDSYIPSDGSQKKVTYDKPQVKRDEVSIQKMMQESEDKYQDIKQMVMDLLKKQGFTDGQIKNVQLKDVKVDKETQEQAQAAIAPGGEYSAENVSDNILKFAQAVSGGDKSKLNELKGAIDKGFDEAKKALGGKLPDVCQETYKLVNDKLDKWENEPEETAS